VLGAFDASTDAYHGEILRAASDEVVFPGAIYDPEVVTALRFHSRCYVHGHTVGGTNPSLVEAMAAANPVIAHDNVYNRWVAGERSRFFRSEDELASLLDVLLDDTEELSAMSRSSRGRHRTEFTWEHVAAQYEQLLRRHLPGTWTEQPVSHTPGRGST
jgi:glycosyltransferase involved in cell wall biosynthesis